MVARISAPMQGAAASKYSEYDRERGTMKTNILIAGLMTGMITTQAAEASDGLSYSHVDLGYASAEVDGFNDESLDGPTLRLRAALNPRWFFALEANRLDGEFEFSDFSGQYSEQVDVEANEMSAGFGYVLAENERTSYYGQVNLLSVEATAFTLLGRQFTADEFGQELRLGARFAPSQQVELEASARHQILGGEFESETFFVAGAHLKLSKQVALGIESQFGGDSRVVAGSLRVYF
jgi:hypothetical protein